MTSTSARALAGALALMLCAQGCITTRHYSPPAALDQGRVWVDAYTTHDGQVHACHCWATLSGPDRVRLQWDGSPALPSQEISRSQLASLEGTHIEAGPTIAAWAVIAAVVGAVVLIRNSSPASCSWNAADCFK